MSYYAAALLSDGRPDDVQYGFSVDEAHASNVALRIANLMECDAVVVDDTTGKITQTIRYRPGIDHLHVPRNKTTAPSKERVTRKYLSNVSTFDESFYPFIQKHVGEGYTIVITPRASLWKVPDHMVNIVASRHNG